MIMKMMAAGKGACISVPNEPANRVKWRMEHQSHLLAARRTGEDGHWWHWYKPTPAPMTTESSRWFPAHS